MNKLFIKILVSEKVLSNINFKRPKKTLVCIKNSLTDLDINLHLTFDSLRDIYLNYITL